MNWYYSPDYNRAASPSEMNRERTVVKMLLQAFDLSKSVPKLLGDHRKRYGVSRLIFESFDRFYPTFPWQMMSMHLHHIQEPFVTLKLPSKMQESYAEYREHYDYCRNQGRAEGIEPGQEHRPLAVLFTAGHVARGGLVVHNGTPQSDGGRLEDTIVLNDGVKLRVYVERYTRWLDGVVASGWTPKTPLPTPDVGGHDVETPPIAPVDRWMIEAAGSDREIIVLATLYGICQTGTFGGKAVEWVRREGEVCLLMSHSELAAGLGKHPEYVRRGLRTLKKKGLVWTKGNAIRLTEKAEELASEVCDAAHVGS